MTTYIGKHSAKIDQKGRVFVPSVYRKILIENGNERVVMRKDADNDCIIFYPESIWNKKVDELQASLDEWDAEDQMLLAAFTEEADWLDIDSQGRVLLSKTCQQAISLEDNDLLFIGLVDRFSVWSKNIYENRKLSSADMAARLKEKMMQKKQTL